MQFGFTLNRFKSMFFDRKLVEGTVDRRTRAVFSRLGAFIRQSARRSFRSGSAKKVVPGKAPRNLTGLLRDSILFAWDSSARSVVVGPWLFSKQKQDVPAPALLEHSGTTTRYVKLWKRNVTFRYRKFPFMGPALNENLPLLPQFWRNTI